MSVQLPATSHTSLLGKVALVTGGAVGIGRAVALALAGSGADVAITYHTHNGDEMAKEIAQMGRRAEAFRADMRLSADADATVEAVRRELGMIDVLVANAGGLIGRVPLASMSNEHWHDVLDTNLSSAFYVIRAALAHMNDDARIVLISSMAANTGGSAGAGAVRGGEGGDDRSDPSSGQGAGATRDRRQRHRAGPHPWDPLPRAVHPAGRPGGDHRPATGGEGRPARGRRLRRHVPRLRSH